MSKITCKWVEAHLDEFLQGGGSPTERENIDLHLAVCTSCLENARIWSFLLREAPQADMRPLSPETERRLLSGDEPASRTSATGRELPRTAIAVTALAAATAALALWVTGFGPPSQPAAPVPTPGDGAPRQMAMENAPTMSSRSAEQRIGGQRAIPVLPGTTLWLSEEAEVGIESLDAETARFHLTHGFVVADIEPADLDFRFDIVTPKQVVEARGTIFSVSVTTEGEAHVRVSEGTVEVRATDGSGGMRLVTAGQEMIGLEAPPKAATPVTLLADLQFVRAPIPLFPSPYEHPSKSTGRERDGDKRGATGTVKRRASPPGSEQTSTEQSPEKLLKLAKELRGARAYDAAAATYEKILAEFPRRREAGIAMVALGQLRLSALRQPGNALALFDAYIDRSPNGNLGAAARSGRVRALSAMGRHREVIHGVDAYLESFPTGATAAEMRRRKGESLAALGDCSRAIKEFQHIVRRWPDSAEAVRAQAGLDGCDNTR